MESIEFLGFGLNAWITIVTVFSMFTVLLFTKWRSDIVFLGAIGVLFVTGVLDAKGPPTIKICKISFGICNFLQNLQKKY